LHKNGFAGLPWPKHRNSGELLCGKQKLVLQFSKKLCHIVNIVKFAQKRHYFLQFRNLIADLQKILSICSKHDFAGFKKIIVPSAEKKCIFIGRGKENAILLHRSISVYFCGLDWLENMPYIRGAENQKIGRRNESEGNERRSRIHGDKIHETLILRILVQTKEM